MPGRKARAEANSSDLLRDSWENLGVAFAINESGTKNADPEQTLLASLCEFQDDRKLLKLALAWLGEYGDLVHVERIKALAAERSAVELAWLGGIARHQTEGVHSRADRRWHTVAEMVRKRLGVPCPRFQTSQLDELLARKNGADQGFQPYGLTIPGADPADPKKLYLRPHAIQGNLWLRMRALFGTNWRADVATVMLLGRAKTSYQAEKLLGCSTETAYRNWNALKEADLLTMLKQVA